MYSLVVQEILTRKTWPRGYKMFFMLNSVQHRIYPVNKC